MKIFYQKGDLFTSPENVSLAHCVSQDLKMGAGIALIFKKKFGMVQQLLSLKEKVGGVAILEDNHRFIYYLITKERYFKKPNYANLKASLIEMRNHMMDNDISELNIPRIGCGLDRLKWEKVELILKAVFESDNVTITVYSI